MRKKWKRLGSLLLTLVLALSLCACGSKKKDEETVNFTIACATWVGNGMFFLAKEKGYFDQYGLNVTIKIIDDESTYASLLGSEQVDAVARASDQDVINYASGIKEKCVMSYDQSYGGDGIIVSEDIQSVEDLKGKTVAVAKATTSYFFLLTVLESAGVSEDDLVINDMDADSAGTAFVQGEVDAAVTWEPWLSNAGEREGGHILCSSADYPNTIVDSLFVTDAFSDAHPQAVKDIIKAEHEALDWYNDGNQAEGNKIMAEALGIELADFEAQIEGVSWYDADTMKAFFDENAEASIYALEERAMNLWVERGLISKAFDVKDFVTSEFIDK
ncbi:MAG: ABC transporter substrate-binding protein [Wujia sp.]